MSDQTWLHEVDEYIATIPFAVLSYVRQDGIPVQRSLGSYAKSGINVYFSTRKDAAKVSSLQHNPLVSFFFEADNQALPKWRSVLLLGKAILVTDSSELNNAVEALSSRNPRFKQRVADNGLADTAIFRVESQEIEFLDYSKGLGHVQKLTLAKQEVL
jgi:general stress protein 26